MSAQATAAALVTFALFKLTGMPQASWAVISALFVIQPNVGATIGAALSRIAGTAVGTGVGLACALAVGTSTWEIVLGLLVAIGSVGFIIGLRPELRYGLVPAALILLAPGGDELEMAWHGAAAIGIGAVIGSLIGLVVFPETAHRSVERQLAEAVSQCGDLLRATVRCLLGDSQQERMIALSEGIESRLWAAGAVAAGSRYPSRLRRRPLHPRPRALLRAVERLWHALLLLRVDDVAVPERARSELAPALQNVATAGHDYLGSLGSALESNVVPATADSLRQRTRELSAAFDRLRRRRATEPLENREVERIFTLAFAVGELERSIEELAALFSGPAASRTPQADAAPG